MPVEVGAGETSQCPAKSQKSGDVGGRECHGKCAKRGTALPFPGWPGLGVRIKGR